MSKKEDIKKVKDWMHDRYVPRDIYFAFLRVANEKVE